MARGERRCSTGEDLARLAVAKFARGQRVDEVVHSGAAAADFGLLQFNQFEAGDALQDRPRLLADALGVLEMAGILVGEAERERVILPAGRKLGQQFADIAHCPLRSGLPALPSARPPRAALHRP
ncbi:MAG: hypothetical protein KatS3mg061_2988 [Dehalococcoidia bacterium]|nr:MAG: hypothetical protein KatS3mg061_2988 [Dehalococcoidia bacterium]